MEREALPRLVDAGRLSQAAKLHNELAELLEAEGMPEQAIENFEKASDLFSAENATTSSHKALIRVAHLCATLDSPQLDRAADIFGRVGQECLSNNLLKFQAKGYFFNGFLCILARTDVVAAEAALNRFKEMDYTFPGSRECKLCEDILQVRALPDRRVRAGGQTGRAVCSLRIGFRFAGWCADRRVAS